MHSNVVLEPMHSNVVLESMSFTDLPLNLRTQKVRRLHFGFDVGQRFAKLKGHGVNLPHHGSLCLGLHPHHLRGDGLHLNARSSASKPGWSKESKTKRKQQCQNIAKTCKTHDKTEIQYQLQFLSVSGNFRVQTEANKRNHKNLFLHTWPHRMVDEVLDLHGLIGVPAGEAYKELVDVVHVQTASLGKTCHSY